MKKKYFDLEMDFIYLSMQDVVTLSMGKEQDDNDVFGDDVYGDE